ncbi:MAG: TonB-dependent receptor [Bacteroidales bacterium]|nr:TonB-dependent receptor [Bacteroidales bacterium]
MSIYLEKFILVFFCLLFFSETIYGEIPTEKDTAKIRLLPEIIVSEKFQRSEIRSTTPLQILSAKKIENLNVLQVSDAIKYFSGVNVKDYGGIGGLKTVSVRSFGAEHTAVSYDGITLTDCQTGQIDLGRFSLDNVDMLSLNNGQGDNIFLPARFFASSSVLNIRTLEPSFGEKEKLKGKISLKTGSFGLINTSLLLETKINRNVSATFGGEWLSANGEYPYRVTYGTQEGDSSSIETRKNTDVATLRLEGTIYANFAWGGSGYLKSYYYSSERGLPGAVIYYMNENTNHQRSNDRTFFTQAHFEKKISPLWSFQTNAKYHNGFLHYLDPNYNNSDGKIDNTYLQEEYYISASLLFKAFEKLSFSFSTDYSLNTLEANLPNFAYPKRNTVLTVFNAKYASNQWLATAGCLGTLVNGSVKNGETTENQQHISPFFSFAVKPFESHDFRFRCFYKNNFRLPTFNDLYYSYVGNRNLKPENAQQFNAGITWNFSTEKLSLFSVTLDAYHNEITNKIVAFPNKDLFNWTMKNCGKVSVDGLDLTAESGISIVKNIGLVIGASYTYQRALNITNPNEDDYKHQIPYTPRISGSGKAALEMPWFNLSYSFIWSGHRYSLFQNYASNRLPGFADHNLLLSRNFKTSRTSYSLQLELNNFLDKNYEIVRGFPMPGRSLRATVAVKF